MVSLGEFKVPEVATVVRWLLRFILVIFLVWLARRKQDSGDEEEEEDEEPDRNRMRGKGAGRGAGMRQPAGNRITPGTASAGLRQRNMAAAQRGGVPGGESMDFDEIINRMSKPKNMWEANRGGPPQILKQTAPPPATAASGRAAVLPGSRSAALQGGMAKRPKENVFHGHERPVTWITLNRDGNLLFSCGKDKVVLVWSFPDGDCLGKYVGHNGAIWACSVTRDSRWMVSCGADRLVIVWEARTSLCLTKVELPGVTKFVEWAGRSGTGDTSDKEQFATCHNRFGQNPASITVWTFDGTEATKGLEITQMPNAVPANQVRWGRDDATLVSCHDSGELVFWSASDGTMLRQLKAHEAALTKFDFSSDRGIVATTSVDMHIKLWDIREGSSEKPLRTAKSDRPLNGVAIGSVSTEEFLQQPPSRECCIIAGGGQDARDVALTNSSGEQFETLCFRLEAESDIEFVANMKGHFGPIHTVAWAADGTAFASGSEDGCVRVHLVKDIGTNGAEKALRRQRSDEDVAAKEEGGSTPAGGGANDTKDE